MYFEQGSDVVERTADYIEQFVSIMHIADEIVRTGFKGSPGKHDSFGFSSRSGSIENVLNIGGDIASAHFFLYQDEIFLKRLMLNRHCNCTKIMNCTIIDYKINIL